MQKLSIWMAHSLLVPHCSTRFLYMLHFFEAFIGTSSLSSVAKTILLLIILYFYTGFYIPRPAVWPHLSNGLLFATRKGQTHLYTTGVVGCENYTDAIKHQTGL